MKSCRGSSKLPLQSNSEFSAATYGRGGGVGRGLGEGVGLGVAVGVGVADGVGVGVGVGVALVPITPMEKSQVPLPKRFTVLVKFTPKRLLFHHELSSLPQGVPTQFAPLVVVSNDWPKTPLGTTGTTARK
jgi:hypothetical protein